LQTILEKNQISPTFFICKNIELRVKLAVIEINYYKNQSLIVL